MDEIKQTINTLRDSCDSLDQLNANLVGAYQQLEQLLTSIEKYIIDLIVEQMNLQNHG